MKAEEEVQRGSNVSIRDGKEKKNREEEGRSVGKDERVRERKEKVKKREY